MFLRGLAAFLAAGSILLCSSVPATADAQSDLAAAQAKQKQLDQVKQQLGASIASSLTEQDQLTRSLEENRKHEQVLADKQAEAAARLAQLDAEIARTQANVEQERRQLRALARTEYAQPDSLLVSLAASSSLADLFTRLSDLQVAGERASALKARLEADVERVSRDRDEQAKLNDQLGKELGQLRELATQQQQSLATLQSKLSEFKTELDKANQQSAATAKLIADALQAEQNQITAAAYQALWTQVQLIGGQLPAGPGASHMADPLPGAVETQPFGPTPYTFEPPYDGYPHFHTGVDLSLPAGTPVHAAADGIVVVAGFNTGGYGNFVVVAHAGGIATLYGHLQQILVKTGQQVAMGQPIGLEGSTGMSTGPHLHFEVRVNGKPTDPAPFIFPK